MGHVKSYQTVAINPIETHVSHRSRLAGEVVLLASIFLLGCGIESGPQVAENHEWYRPPQNTQNEMVIIASELVFPVHSAVLEEAILDLEQVSSIQLSPKSMFHYVQRDVPKKSELRPFLVRALDGGGSRFAVRQGASALWINATHGNGQVKPQPLVVLLDTIPINVFLTVAYDLN